MAMNQLTKRLNRIFEAILGCSFQYQSVENLNADEWSSMDLAALRSDLTEKPQFIEGSNASSFGFPIYMKGVFSGLAVVNNFSESQPQKLIVLAELLSMLMESGIRNEDRQDRLRLIEERLTMLDIDSNVIPLRPARYEKVLQVVDTGLVSEMGASPLVTTPLLLETNVSFPLSRVAIEVHHQSKRWAFISVEDLPQDVFNTRENIEQLGGLTLFIRDLAALTTNQQLKLAEYLGSAPTEDMPHVIAGVNESVADLQAAGRILPHLAQLFAVSNLQKTDKTPMEISKDLITASLMHIVSQTTESHAHGEHFIPFHSQYFSADETPNSFH